MTIVSMNYLLEAGVHFGHQKRRWNPKMKPYIYTERDDIYIIDLQKTVKQLEEAYEAMTEIANQGGKVLFVGTKKQASEAAEENAVRTNNYFINERWLGGTLTNFKTIRSRIKRMEDIEKQEEDGIFELLPKKEVIKIRKEYDKLNKNLRGIREMKSLPQALVIVDPRKEEIAIKEAKILGIPVFGVVDTNCDPDLVDYVIPGNDDAVRSVKILLGVLTNAYATVAGCEVVDYITEEDRQRKDTDNVEEVKYDLKVENKYDEKKEYNRGFKKDFRKHNDRKFDKNKKDNNFKKDVKEDKKDIKKEEVKKVVKEEKEVKKEEVKKENKSPKKVKEDLSSLTLAELKEKAKSANIKGYSTMKKQEVIDALEKNGD